MRAASFPAAPPRIPAVSLAHMGLATLLHVAHGRGTVGFSGGLLRSRAGIVDKSAGSIKQLLPKRGAAVPVDAELLEQAHGCVLCRWCLTSPSRSAPLRLSPACVVWLASQGSLALV